MGRAIGVVLILVFFRRADAMEAIADAWESVDSHTTASLRGLCVLKGGVIWASGTKGTIVRSIDDGATWQVENVAGAEALDFRSIQAFDGLTALAMSSGTGASSTVYRTSDGGRHWERVFVNPDPHGFFDALAFWDRRKGLIVGDPVDGHFGLFRTVDGGATWQHLPGPAALAEEGLFAASGTSVVLGGRGRAWFGTGGAGMARVLRSSDFGKSWSAHATPLRSDSKSAGIFSLAHCGDRRMIAAGGDYRKPGETRDVAAYSEDDGKTWRLSTGATGYRSAIAFKRESSCRHAVAGGTNGEDWSEDGGKSWRPLAARNVQAVGSSEKAFWAIGPGGSIAKLPARPSL